MTSRETIESYFAALERGEGREACFADEVEFATQTVPAKRVNGRDAFLESTRGFYGMIASVQVNELIVEEHSVCALTSYVLQPPVGDAFTSDVAEVFTVADDRITSFSIYFDSAPYPTPPDSRR